MNGSTSARPLYSWGTAQQGVWQLSWASTTGSRHIEAGKPCEDSVAHRFDWQGGMAVALGDGVSGGALGQLASDAAACHCVHWRAAGPAPTQSEDCTLADPENALLTHVNELDAVVRDALAQHTLRAGATTLAAAWLQADGSGWLTHVGDVRAYAWTPKRSSTPALLDRLSRDQTYTQLGELPPAGVPHENPARMLGNTSAGELALQRLALAPGKGLLLCSDGLHGFLTDREMADVLGSTSMCAATTAPLARLPRRLINRALANGSDDDIAAMLLFMRTVTA